jgi:Tubulin like
MSMYIFAIGGTGAKCAEAIVHGAAAGWFFKPEQPDEKIKIFFIDPDDANGNVARARDTLLDYQRCRKLLKLDMDNETSWMRTEIESTDIWSPFAKQVNKTLNHFFDYASYAKTSVGSIFELLYSEAERLDDLKEGFHGRPAVGSAVFSQVNLSEVNDPFWQKILGELEAEKQNEPTIFLCGSIFGGTGASGFPTLAKLIYKELKNRGISFRLGGVLMLPYFTFEIPPEQDRSEIFAKPNEFLQNTEIALEYYLEQAKSTFNTIYLLGDGVAQKQVLGKFSKGQANQVNLPHFLEMYGALAARHFWLYGSNDMGQVGLMTTKKPNYISWNDLPKDFPSSMEIKLNLDVAKSLINLTRFAFSWHSGLDPMLKNSISMGARTFHPGAPWFELFFDPDKRIFNPQNMPRIEDSSEQEMVKALNNWCERYLKWISHITYSSSDRLKLFNVQYFMDRDGLLKKGNIHDLSSIVNDYSFKESKDDFNTTINFSLRQIKNDYLGGKPGTSSLAKSLYWSMQPDNTM